MYFLLNMGIFDCYVMLVYQRVSENLKERPLVDGIVYGSGTAANYDISQMNVRRFLEQRFTWIL